MDSPHTKLDKGIDAINEFILDREDILEKGGKRANVGEVRQFGGKPYVKTANGWRPQVKGKTAKTEDNPTEQKSNQDKPHDSEGRGNLSDEALHDFKMETLQDSIHRVRKIHDDAKASGDKEKQQKAAAKLTEHKNEYDQLKANAPKKDNSRGGAPSSANDKDAKKQVANNTGKGGIEKKQTVHISDMTAFQKIEIAKKLGIKDADTLSMKELDKQMIAKNVEKQLKEFKNKKKAAED